MMEKVYKYYKAKGFFYLSDLLGSGTPRALISIVIKKQDVEFYKYFKTLRKNNSIFLSYKDLTKVINICEEYLKGLKYPPQHDTITIAAIKKLKEFKEMITKDKN